MLTGIHIQYIIELETNKLLVEDLIHESFGFHINALALNYCTEIHSQTRIEIPLFPLTCDLSDWHKFLWEGAIQNVE